jgi:GT2 family glycosyltransferase
MKAAVSIIIPTWNGLDLLKQFLPSVLIAAARYSRESEAPTEIVIVDDGSLDDTAAWLKGEGFSEHRETFTGRTSRAASENEQPTLLRFLRNEKNQGFGETCNRGVNAALHPLVFLLNNDVEVAPDSIAPLAEKFSDADVFSVHCEVYEFESGLRCGTGKLGSFSRGFIRVHRSYVPADSMTGNRMYSMFASGGSAMFDRKKFLEMGGFEQLLNPFYWEDVEISYRAWKRGYVVLFEPHSQARHRISSTIRKINQAKVQRAQQRNRLIYHWINLHDRRLAASHILWVALLTLTAPFRLKFGYISAVFSAMKQWPEIRKKRSREKSLAKRTDRDVFDIFSALERNANLFAYDRLDELKASKDSSEPSKKGN